MWAPATTPGLRRRRRLPATDVPPAGVRAPRIGYSAFPGRRAGPSTMRRAFSVKNAVVPVLLEDAIDQVGIRMATVQDEALDMFVDDVPEVLLLFAAPRGRCRTPSKRSPMPARSLPSTAT